MKIQLVPIPTSSLARHALDRIDYFDSYQIEIPKDPGQEPERELDPFIRNLFRNSPRWTGILMKLRDRIVGLMGLKTHTLPSQQILEQIPIQPGSKFGLFQVFARTKDEVLFGADDKHLDFRVSIHRFNQGDKTQLTLSTLVRFNHPLGRLYFALIKPIHKQVVKGMVKSLVE